MSHRHRAHQARTATAPPFALPGNLARIAGGLVLLVLATLAWRQPPSRAYGDLPASIQVKIEPLVLEELASAGRTDYFVWLAARADLAPANRLASKEEKGRYVLEALTATAEATQRDLRRQLDRDGADYQAFYIANKILVRGGDGALLLRLAARPDVARITANHRYQLPDPQWETDLQGQGAGVGANISFVRAHLVWAMGYIGQGVVLAGTDTGIDETHPALARHYRGCLDPPACSAWDHNYNWWDPTGLYPDDPWDANGHGTHTTGTMVGDDGAFNQIGMAPGAQTIHCKAFGAGGGGTTETILECFQWDLAPWDLAGQNPRPDLAPDAVNGSWGFPGAYDGFEDEVAALQAAGIAMEFSAGNEGPSCGTLISPADYAQVISTGAIDYLDPYPGTILGFSSRGPSELHPGEFIPDVMAPGQSVRSAVPGGGYEYGQGTSMAGPHVTGLIGLLWSVNPALRGQVPLTYEIIQQSAVPLTGQYGSFCGGDYIEGPNLDWGHGTIDAHAAALLAQALRPGTLEGQVTDAASSLPIEGARVRAERGAGGVWEMLTGAGGEYGLELLSGEFDVSATAFGYAPELVSGVVVPPDGAAVQDSALEPLPWYAISGTVTNESTGAPLRATVEALDAPLEPVWSDPATGHYSLALPAGTHTLRMEAALHQVAYREVTVDGDQELDLALVGRPCLLLVDDDMEGPDVLPLYAGALDALGLAYDVWDTLAAGSPALEDLAGYRMVVWFTGHLYWTSFSEGDEAVVGAYLDAGGRFFLSSVGYLWERGLTPFGQDYLGITAFTAEVGETEIVGNEGNPVGAGLGPYSLVPPPDWIGPVGADHVEGSASPFRFVGSGQSNSVNHQGPGHRSVFLGWPLEAIAAEADRAAVLAAAIDWLGGCCQAPSGLDFAWSPQAPQAGQVVTFTGTATGTLPITYTWALGDGATAAGATVSHSYAVAGAYAPVMVAANCAAPPNMISHTLTIEPTCSEVEILTVTTEISDCTVTFGAELSGTAPYSYTWSFGDGLSSTLPAPVHAYTQSGSYDGALEARNCSAGYASLPFGVEVMCGSAPAESRIYLPLILCDRGG